MVTHARETARGQSQKRAGAFDSKMKPEISSSTFKRNASVEHVYRDFV